MIFFVLFPVGALVVIVMQVFAADFLFGGALGMEISLLFVIYAGFYWSVLRGLWAAMVFGFMLDTLTGTAPFFYLIFYVLVFVGARLASYRIYGEAGIAVMAATFICACIQAFLAVLIGIFSGGSFLFSGDPGLAAVNAAFLALISPLLFYLFKKIEDVVNAQPRQA